MQEAEVRFYSTADEVSRKRAKSGRKDKTEGKDKTGERKFIGRPPCQPWGDYTEELIPLLLVGRRSETDPGRLEVGCDAGEYGGETGAECEAGVPSTCEPGETAEPAVLAWLPNISSKRRRAPRCLPLPG